MEVVGSNDEVNRQQEQGPEGAKNVGGFVRLSDRIGLTSGHGNLHGNLELRIKQRGELGVLQFSPEVNG